MVPPIPSIGDISAASDAGDTTLGAVTINASTGQPRQAINPLLLMGGAAMLLITLAIVMRKGR